MTEGRPEVSRVPLTDVSTGAESDSESTGSPTLSEASLLSLQPYPKGVFLLSLEGPLTESVAEQLRPWHRWGEGEHLGGRGREAAKCLSAHRGPHRTDPSGPRRHQGPGHGVRTSCWPLGSGSWKGTKELSGVDDWQRTEG